MDEKSFTDIHQLPSGVSASLKPRSLTFSAPESNRASLLNGHSASSTTNRSPSPSFAEAKAFAQAKLKDELKRYQDELKFKDEEVTKLSKVKDQINAEVEELTASLFEEANSMVLEANIKQSTAEKKLLVAENKIEALETEIVALRQVIESNDNFSQGQSDKARRNLTNPFRQFSSKFSSKQKRNQEMQKVLDSSEVPEIDSVYYSEFLQWLDKPDLDYAKPFLARIYGEDILTCLELSNKNLTQIVQRAIERNTFHMETLVDPVIRQDALNGIKQQCKYRMKCTDDSEDWLFIGQNTRNRPPLSLIGVTLKENMLSTVCDFYNYVRYIQDGLVKSNVNEMYRKIMILRKSMAAAKLGFLISQAGHIVP